MRFFLLLVLAIHYTYTCISYTPKCHIHADCLYVICFFTCQINVAWILTKCASTEQRIVLGCFFWKLSHKTFRQPFYHNLNTFFRKAPLVMFTCDHWSNVILQLVCTIRSYNMWQAKLLNVIYIYILLISLCCTFGFWSVFYTCYYVYVLPL